MPADTETTHEARLRRQARQQGLALRKSRSRTPEHADFGTYELIDTDRNYLVAYGLPDGYGLNLDEIEAALNE